ncbi:MAG: GDSL-type esterase/lipase family protein [Kofleriaceae bacterium]
MKLGWLLIAFGVADAAPKVKPPDAAALDDPKHSLDAVRKAIAAKHVRISWFGDSVTADDQITNGLRHRLQAQIGDGGPGFLWGEAPHPYCQHRAAASVASEEWTTHGISTTVPPDRLLGLGGSTETESGGTIRIAPAAQVGNVDLHYLAQPHGGSLELVADGKVVTKLDTQAADKKGMFFTAQLADPAKKLELRAKGRVRMFGIALENATGAIVDNLGVVNATAKAMRNHDMEEHWRNQLAHRAPDLIVVMYGTNEAEWLAAKGQGMAEHEKLFGELLANAKLAAPNAACLVISPLDQLDWRDEKMPARESVPAMVEAQHRAALANGCAFWDTFAWMGGKGSSATWYRQGLIVKDFQHPTSEGADRIAEALYEGLTK